MTKTTSDRIASFFTLLGASIKSIVKIILQSRRPSLPPADDPSSPLIIMGNGPSLNDTIRDHTPTLTRYPAVAVNFAACAPVFLSLRPAHYVLADPFFFSDADTDNLRLLRHRLSHEVDWPMTLYVPCRHRAKAAEITGDNPSIRIACFNPVGVEGFQWLEDLAFSKGYGMPRPRNVLIPAIMIGISLGHRDIHIVGADHSWMQTLSVDDQNRVISIQPHFYKDGEQEKTRIATEYHQYPLHSIINSFYVAFRAYHTIQRYALRHGIRIYNSTPSSFIDAFPRAPLP